MSVVTYRFRAMNTDIAVLASAAGKEFDQASAVVHRIFVEVERCLSRFIPDSDLFVLNQSGGRSVPASPLLFKAVSYAVRAAEDTDGVFDPTVLSALEHAGYDRSFEHIVETDRTFCPLGYAMVLPDYRAIHCDRDACTIRLAAGQRIDLGGIGKGLAVDLALDATTALQNRCIVAGGDMAVRGTAGPEEEWSIALEDSGNGTPCSIAVRDSAVATSTTGKRRWQVDGKEQHHLIDTRTGLPSVSSLRTVTVVAPTCVQADVAAKTVLLLGVEGMDFLDQRGMHGFAVRHDGTTICTSQWPETGQGK